MKNILLLSFFLCSCFSIATGQLSNVKKSAKSMVQNAIPSLSNKTPDQGITSKTHEKYVSQIVFSDNLNDIQFKSENPSGFKNKFSASEPIYARLYLNHSIGNTPHNGDKSYKAQLMYDLYIDGKKVPFKKAFGMYRHIPDNDRTFYIEDIDGDQMNVWTSWRPTLLPNESDDELKYGNVNTMARCFALSLLDIEPGSHTVELKMYSQDMASGNKTDVLATGKFTLNLTNSDKKELAFKYAPPLPKDTWVGNNKETVIKDITLAFEKELRKKPIITGIYSPDWNEGTYSLTGQRYRKVAAWAVFEDGDGDGQVPVTTFNFISDYSGGEWTKPRFDSFCNGCPDWDVEVEAVKALVNNN